jgi:hypothetical protein
MTPPALVPPVTSWSIPTANVDPSADKATSTPRCTSVEAPVATRERERSVRDEWDGVRKILSLPNDTFCYLATWILWKPNLLPNTYTLPSAPYQQDPDERLR